jgi:hypothetical protein
VLLEEQGTPATVVLTEPFQGLAASFATTLGMPAYPTVVVPHPIAPRSDAELDELADAVADAVIARLTPASASPE